ncbi:uncharacterized protein LOC135144207 [Zophobas morio]|uniref:uncharacterized protein LOC135144207 n=1 Tax=Zophobas morio TaxID=2755281 RepID=UPI003083C392
MPLVVYKDICLSKYNVTLVGRSEHEVLSWSYCCNLIEKPFGNCTRVMMNICSILKDKADFDINSITFDETKKKALKWKKEYSYWYYTHNTQERVGHAVNRLLQLYHLISFSKSNPLKMPSVSLIVSARSPMLSGAYVVDLANYLIPNWKSMSIFSEDFNKEVNGSICFEKLVEVDPYQHEQVFFSKSQGEEWRSFLNLNFNIEDKLCPPAKAVVLQRIEGK